jgi:hypothetical protein
MSDASLPQCPICLVAEPYCDCPPCENCSSILDDRGEWTRDDGHFICTICNSPMTVKQEAEHKRRIKARQIDPAWQAEQAQRRRLAALSRK